MKMTYNCKTLEQTIINNNKTENFLTKKLNTFFFVSLLAKNQDQEQRKQCHQHKNYPTTRPKTKQIKSKYFYTYKRKPAEALFIRPQNQTHEKKPKEYCTHQIAKSLKQNQTNEKKKRKNINGHT